MTLGNIKPCPTSVMRITENVKNRMRSRYGNGWPEETVSGMASAAASETMPRMPVNAIKNGHCHGGEGSFLLILGNSHRGRYVAGNTQTNLATMTVAVMTATETARCETEYSLIRPTTVRACSPVMRNTIPSST